MMSPSLATERLACWNCCQRPTNRSIGCETRLANIWKAISMPMLNVVEFMTV